MASKGLPWAGAYKNPGKAADNYPPPGGHPGPNAVSATGGESSVNQFVHESLKGPQKPDQGPIGKRTYG